MFGREQRDWDPDTEVAERWVVPGRAGMQAGEKRPVQCAHLFDQDLPRLIATARGLGLRKPLIHRLGQPGQHVDLWGAPLEKAERLAKQMELIPAPSPGKG